MGGKSFLVKTNEQRLKNPKKGVTTSISSDSPRPLESLCFFHCLALHKKFFRRRTERAAKQLFLQFSPGGNPTTFSGVTLDDIDQLESIFNVGVSLYQIEENSKDRVAILIRGSTLKYADIMHLEVTALDDNRWHLDYISNIKLYCRSYICEKCKYFTDRANNLTRHICSAEPLEIFKSGVFWPRNTIFEDLAKLGVNTTPQEQIYPFVVTFDCESFFSKEGLPKNASVTVYTVRHKLLSLSLASNVPGYEIAECIIARDDDDAEYIVQTFIDRAQEISDAAYTILQRQFQWIFSALQTNSSDTVSTTLELSIITFLPIITIYFSFSITL